MIQITRKTAAAIPNILLTEGARLTDLMHAAHDAGERDFEIDKTIYGHTDVKDALIGIQNGKCCFCEAKITHIDDGDIEHFRPKKGYRQSNSDSLHKPGYYWLSYDWDNLFLACTKCNQRNKGNLFPLMAGSVRATSHTNNINAEKPIFIHPSQENPSAFISFYDEVVRGTDAEGRGAKAIEYLGLDRPALEEDRREHLGNLKSLYKIIRLVPQTPVEIRKEALTHLQKEYTKKTKETYEYAGMYRAFFRNNPIPVI
jgi:uncharacterized protein (TIGR02646 family)